MRLADQNIIAYSTKKPSHNEATAYFINNGRRLIVDERALADALSNGVIAGAGLNF